MPMVFSVIYYSTLAISTLIIILCSEMLNFFVKIFSEVQNFFQEKKNYSNIQKNIFFKMETSKIILFYFFNRLVLKLLPLYYNMH
jgi:hypothetical protein